LLATRSIAERAEGAEGADSDPEASVLHGDRPAGQRMVERPRVRQRPDASRQSLIDCEGEREDVSHGQPTTARGAADQQPSVKRNHCANVAVHRHREILYSSIPVAVP
jgi:hypothetical protein